MQLTYNHRKKREREREKQSSVHHYQQLGISSIFISFFYSKGKREREKNTEEITRRPVIIRQIEFRTLHQKMVYPPRYILFTFVS
jgi:hypothetical protein